jgi:hypothetical protein
MVREDGEPVGVMVAEERKFRTGSRGYYANGQFEIDGKQYQAQVQLIEIGSKAAAKRR